MPWNLLIFPLLGGYYLLSRFHLFKFKQQRLDRQRLIFDTVLLGIVILTITFILRFVFESVLPGVIQYIYKFFPIKTPFIGTTFCSFLLAVLTSEIGNKTIYREHRKQIDIAIKQVGNELDLILRSSFKDSKLLEFSLDSDKFYICWVKELPIPTVTSYVRVIPVFSGYRDQQKKLVFTTHYLSVYSEYIKEGRIKSIEELDVDLIISLDNVVTVSYFDIEMYDRFNKPSNEDGK